MYSDGKPKESENIGCGRQEGADFVADLQAQLEARNREVASLIATVASQARALEHAEKCIRTLAEHLEALDASQHGLHQHESPSQSARPEPWWHHYGSQVVGVMLAAVLASTIVGNLVIGIDWGSVWDVGRLTLMTVGSVLTIPAYLRALSRQKQSARRDSGVFRYATRLESWAIMIGAVMMSVSGMLLAIDLPV